MHYAQCKKFSKPKSRTLTERTHRYHISKLYRKPLDKLRIAEMARLKAELPTEEYAKLEGMMWILRKNHECLSEANKAALALLYNYSPKLKQAHTYALRLTHIFNTHTNRKSAISKVNHSALQMQSLRLRHECL